MLVDVAEKRKKREFGRKNARGSPNTGGFRGARGLASLLFAHENTLRDWVPVVTHGEEGGGEEETRKICRGSRSTDREDSPPTKEKSRTSTSHCEIPGPFETFTIRDAAL